MHPRILVIRFGSMGDIILASAPIINLRVAYPSSHITLLTRSAFVPIARLIGEVDEIVCFDGDNGKGRLIATAMELDRCNFDLVVDLHRNARSWAVSKAVTAANKLRYPKRRWERFIATRRHGKRLPKSWPHTIDLYNSVLRDFGLATPADRPVLQVPGSSATRSGGISVAIAPGASYPPKQFPLDRFVALAMKLRHDFGVRVTWVVTQDDAVLLENDPGFREAKGDVLIDRPIPELAEVLAKQDLTIANDSGLMHLSSAVGTPVVGLFGPTHPVLGFAPRGQFDKVLEVDEWCRPCSRHGKKPCFRDKQFCFSGITDDMILDSVQNILDERKGLSRAVFVDRDGTIMVDKHFLSDPDQIEFESGAIDGLRRISQLGYRIVIISNQSGVARGLFGIETVERVNGRLIEMLAQEGINLAGCYYCPYLSSGKVPEFSIEHRGRKPAPGMPEEAATHLGLDLRRSFVVGDKLDDFYLGSIIGAYSILVGTGKGDRHRQLLPEGIQSDSARVVPDLAAAASVIQGLS